MTTVHDIAAFLEEFAPAALAAEWDNVGLLVGRAKSPVERIMTCLTITPTSAAEAVVERADLIVAHHPLPFRPLRRLTDESVEGRLLLDLLGAGVAIYSPHTAFDSTREGINQRLAEGLGLVDIVPLIPREESRAPEADDETAESTASGLGAGRQGRLDPPRTLDQLADRTKRFLGIAGLHVVGDASTTIERVAVACGSAGELLSAARDSGCQALLLGETRFHTCLEAEATGVALVLAGHYATERFAVEQLADVLAARFGDVSVWPSRREKEPLKWV